MQSLGNLIIVSCLPNIQDRDFLKSALADLQSAPSDVDLIKNCLGVVHRVVETVGEASSASDIDEAVEKGEEALEALTDLCEGIDNANGMFHCIGYAKSQSLVVWCRSREFCKLSGDCGADVQHKGAAVETC